ncbi:MAG: hypothetical protein ACXWV2_11710 [Chitinophagaceae bacterium]
MKKRQPELLLHPLFLLSLAILLLNDLFFKYEFHNWFTGKISDVTGLFTFSVFFIAIFPSYKKVVIVLIAIIFCWWKSSLSTPSVNFFNYQLNILFHRVVDYTDLFALLVLPFCLYLKPIQLYKTALQKPAIFLMGVISFTAFTATSLPRRLADDNKVVLDKYVRTKKTEADIIRILEEQGVYPVPDTIYEKVWHDTYYLKPKDTSKGIIPVDSLYTGVYRKINYGFSFSIPALYVAGDSIFNLHFNISDNLKKRVIHLHSFGIDSGNNISGYYTWKKFRKPIKKKFKEMLRK